MASVRKADSAISFYEEVKDLLNTKRVDPIDSKVFYQLRRKLKQITDEKEQASFLELVNSFAKQIQSGNQFSSDQFCIAASICTFFCRSNASFLYAQEATRIDPKNASAWITLGSCYQRGAGVETNKQKGVDFYRKAIELDPKNTLAWFNLGTCYETGTAVPKDEKAAVDCFRKVTTELDPENARAWIFIGKCFLDGRGVPKDEKAAIDCFRKVTTELDPENATAWTSLGFSYLTVSGVGRDEKKGKDCYRKATQLDPKNALAWHNLGVCYGRGLGEDKNIPQAEVYYWLAINYGNIPSLKTIKSLLRLNEAINVTPLAQYNDPRNLDHTK